MSKKMKFKCIVNCNNWYQMRKYGSLMKADLALTARLGIDGLKLRLELQLK